tara:strand:+ start:70 stop:300 length:231 start_codon:yes stop_codon:yes gene_type:complete
MNPQKPEVFPQKNANLSDEFKNEKWKQTRQSLYKSDKNRYATTKGVETDYPAQDAKLISEEEYNKLFQELPKIYTY